MDQPWEKVLVEIYRNAGMVERPARGEDGNWKWDEIPILNKFSHLSDPEILVTITILKDIGLVEEGLMLGYEGGGGAMIRGDENVNEVKEKLREEDGDGGTDEQRSLLLLTERGFDVAREQIHQDNQIRLNRTVTLLTLVLASTAVIDAAVGMFTYPRDVKIGLLVILIAISAAVAMYFIHGIRKGV